MHNKNCISRNAKMTNNLGRRREYMYNTTKSIMKYIFIIYLFSSLDMIFVPVNLIKPEIIWLRITIVSKRHADAPKAIRMRMFMDAQELSKMACVMALQHLCMARALPLLPVRCQTHATGCPPSSSSRRCWAAARTRWPDTTLQSRCRSLLE